MISGIPGQITSDNLVFRYFFMEKSPLSDFLERHYSFRWFRNTWTVKEKWIYVALYVVLFNIGLIPILTISERIGLLSEGSTGSLGVLAIILLFWFGIYQPVINFFMARDGD